MTAGEPIRVAVLTISDAVSRGEREDESGARIAAWARERGHAVVERHTCADEPDTIAELLAAWCDAGSADVVLTTGGTGFTQRDSTPEATSAIIERAAPGVAEAIRQRGAASTPAAWLSRAVAGIRASTLVVNLPGSPGGVADGLAVLDGIVGHAVQLLRGRDTHVHPKQHG